MLSLGKSSKMLRHTVESANICVLSHFQRDKAAVQTSLVTQGSSGQNVQSTKKTKRTATRDNIGTINLSRDDRGKPHLVARTLASFFT